MSEKSACWLFVNPSSGSNEESSAERLTHLLEERLWTVDRVVTIPGDDFPEPRDLDDAGVKLAVIYTGDGSANAVLQALNSWGGEVLVLPGGTMNLLAKRLHGEAEFEEILDIVAGGGALPRRITGARCEAGLAFAGLLVGPGTCFNNVRESMRRGTIAEMASDTIDALKSTSEGPKVGIEGHRLSRDEGYPLLEITPGEHGLQINGYYAEDALDFTATAWATLRRQFREGPNDRLGILETMAIVSEDGSTLPCLIDGEPAECASGSTFEVEQACVDLLATSHDI